MKNTNRLARLLFGICPSLSNLNLAVIIQLERIFVMDDTCGQQSDKLDACPLVSGDVKLSIIDLPRCLLS